MIFYYIVYKSSNPFRFTKPFVQALLSCCFHIHICIIYIIFLTLLVKYRYVYM